jgi:hypothetical protein
MKKLVLSLLFITFWTSVLHAEHNSSKGMDGNRTDNQSSTMRGKLEEQVQEQMKREEKYAREQRFYQGSDYNLSSHEVDPSSLPSVPVIEPEYDFDIDDVYNDSPDL